MNRVVLSGRLTGRPKLAYTPSGVAVAEFRIEVPRERRAQSPDDAFDFVDCVAFRQAALELTTWGDRGYRVNLEGALRREAYHAFDGRWINDLRVHTDRVYFLDPVAAGLTTDPAKAPRVGLPVPASASRG